MSFPLPAPETPAHDLYLAVEAVYRLEGPERAREHFFARARSTPGVENRRMCCPACKGDTSAPESPAWVPSCLLCGIYGFLQVPPIQPLVSDVDRRRIALGLPPLRPIHGGFPARRQEHVPGGDGRLAHFLRRRPPK